MQDFFFFFVWGGGGGRKVGLGLKVSVHSGRLGVQGSWFSA